jgi:hypothetical protein
MSRSDKVQSVIESPRRGTPSGVTTASGAWRKAKEKLDAGLTMGAADVAALLGVTDNTVLVYIERGKLIAERGTTVSSNGRPAWVIMPETVRAALGWAEFNEEHDDE